MMKRLLHDVSSKLRFRSLQNTAYHDYTLAVINYTSTNILGLDNSKLTNFAKSLKPSTMMRDRFINRITKELYGRQ